MSSQAAVQEMHGTVPIPFAAVNDARAMPQGHSEASSSDDSGVTPLSGEVFGALINLSGRRRFTSQRLVLYAVLGAQGHEGAVATAREALALFRGAHQALLRRSGELPGVFCPELEEVYFGKPQGDARIVHFSELAGRALNAIEDKLKSAQELLEALVKETTPLLAVLNQITGIYEEQSRKHSRLMRDQLRGIMTDIETIAREAKMVAFNARIVAARSGQAGREFSVVAGVLSNITGEIDELVKAALNGTAA
jgi:hypothetical protein